MAYFFDFEQDYIGLDQDKIDTMLSMYGLNTYTKAPNKLFGSSYADVLLSPSVMLMFVAGVLCFFGMGIGTGIATLLIVAIYIGAELFFRKKSDERLDEIEASTAIKFRVIRSGRLELVEKEFIVPEDLIVVQSGERVPADAFILESRDLTVDESIFTGSKAPTAKYAGAISKSNIKPTFVYSGSIVLSGIAVCKVSATGVDTKLYQTHGEIKERHAYYTELEKCVRLNVPIFSAIGVIFALILTIVKTSGGAEMIPSAIRGITFGLCFIPAAASAIIRLYYTKGAMSMIKTGTLMKSFADIEKLNSLSVLCIEKEGAISKNSLEVRGIYAKSEELLYKVAALSFDKNSADPVERALMVKAIFYDENIAEVYNENTFIEKIPDMGNSIKGAIWCVGGEKICCVNGTPEQILPMCRLTGDNLFDVQKKCESYYANGCSVIAVACVDAATYKAEVTAGFSYTFVGLIAFSAPLRDSVSTAVKTCRRAGVRIVMLTEDNPNAAASTGSMIGLSGTSVITGEQIDEVMKTGENINLNSDIFAKVTPEQKVYIINSLKDNGEVVAMTGNRIGDTDAMDAADVGITIAQHSVGSTYESADIVMNDDNFLSIAETIAKARQIHRNIKRAMSVLFSGYFAMMLMSFVNILASVQMTLTPAIIAFISMIMIPLSASEYLYGNADIRSSMPPSEFVADKKINFPYLGKSALYGLLSGAVGIASYMFMYNSENANFARSCAFMSFVICMISFVILRFSDIDPLKTFKTAPLLQKIIPAALMIMTFMIIYIPGVNKAFGFAAIDFLELLISIATGILPAVVYFFIMNFIKSNIHYNNN